MVGVLPLTMNSLFSRRDFLRLGTASLAATTLGGCHTRSKSIPGKILGASAKVGHLLRSGSFPSPEIIGEKSVVIVGGGIAGLNAAWKLQKSGITDFTLLELENEVGGNSQSGSNTYSAYPWGAHYLPVPNPESTYVRELLEDLHLIEGYDSQGLPIYDEFSICFPPQDRLFIHGRWQDGIEPRSSLSFEDQQQFEQFWKIIDFYKKAIGSDGKRAFAIPMSFSSKDISFRSLDQISIAQFLDSKQLNSKYLLWYLNYCCKDDYGASIDSVSAWAAVHYFASRIGQGANVGSQSVLTWPEGNGYLVACLRKKIIPHIQTGSLVYKIDSQSDFSTIDYCDIASNRTFQIRAQNVIFAAPRFVAQRIIPKLPQVEGAKYSAWMIANITLKNLPHELMESFSWDNVIYESESLGYVVATHQSLERFHIGTVLTYYHPFTDPDTAKSRKMLLERTHEEWVDFILKDLQRPHPSIRQFIENIDIWLWGHGMIIPTPGYIWGKTKQDRLSNFQKIHFAHSDMSGISIFEEAQYHGIQAAEAVLRNLKIYQKRRPV